MLYFVLGIVGLIAFGTPFIIRGLVERGFLSFIQISFFT